MNEYYKNLPKKSMSAGALLFNEKGEILLVKPNYKDRWSIPGGAIEENESPREACIREVKEEVGLDVNNLVFLSVDYIPVKPNKYEHVNFIFSGGVLSDEDIMRIKIDEKEIESYKFVPIENAYEVLGADKSNLAKRINKCYQAAKTGTAIYLEDGEF